MRKLITIILAMLLLMSCASQRQAVISDGDRDSQTLQILSENYPELVYYYNENVLDIRSIRVVELPDGSAGYKVKYRFKRYYYQGYVERMDCLKLYFPELYNMYCMGLVSIYTMYKYVDERTGQIGHYVAYLRGSSYFYEAQPYYSPYYRPYFRRHLRPLPHSYGPRVVPAPGPRPSYTPPPTRPSSPRVSPQPQQGPQAQPQNVRPQQRPQSSASRPSGGGTRQQNSSRSSNGGRR